MWYDFIFCTSSRIFIRYKKKEIWINGLHFCTALFWELYNFTENEERIEKAEFNIRRCKFEFLWIPFLVHFELKTIQRNWTICTIFRLKSNLKGISHLFDSIFTEFYLDHPTSTKNEISSWKFWILNKRY